MTTRYSLPQHLSTEDHDRAARARTLAALVLACGVFALIAFAGVALLPSAEPSLASAPEVPTAVALPGA